MALVVCPCCGRQREIKPLKKAKQLFCANCGTHGLLVFRRIHAWTDTSTKPGESVEQAQLHTLCGLLWLAVSRHYKPGWAAFKFKSLFGDWPSDDVRGRASSEPPTSMLVKWSEREKQRYIKMVRKREAAAWKEAAE